MKRYCILILLSLFSVLCLTGKPIQSQTIPLKFKVAVDITSDNESRKSIMLSYMKRELRSLHDVKIIDYKEENATWDYCISIVVLQIPYTDGTKTKSVGMTIAYQRRIPHTNFNVLWSNFYKRWAAVDKPDLLVVINPIARLDVKCKEIVAEFDTKYLEVARKVRSLR